MKTVDPLTALLIVYAVMASVMLVLWLVDRWTRNASIADVGSGSLYPDESRDREG